MARINQNVASIELLPLADRSGFTIYNESTSTLRVHWGYGVTAASAVDYTVAIPASGYYESPFGVNSCDGPVYGIWAAAGAGAAQVRSF